jgi:hypothetical protein
MQNIPAVANNKASIITAEYVKLIIYNEYNNDNGANIANSNGIQFQIATSGNTPWTSIGASSNSVGTIFTANIANSNIANTVANTTGTASNVTLLTFSSSYTSDTIDGYEYTPLGGLLAVGQQGRSLRVTSGDTSVQLSGISGNNIQQVLDSQGKIRGSKIELTRGFFNPNTYVLSNAVVRFTGIVTNYSIQEDRQELEDNFTVTLDASSYKTILENRIAGRKTNKNSWQFYDSTDSAMNNVNSLAGFTFDFGVDPKTKTTTPGYSGGGLPGGGGMTPNFGNFNPSLRK